VLPVAMSVRMPAQTARAESTVSVTWMPPRRAGKYGAEERPADPPYARWSGMRQGQQHGPSSRSINPGWEREPARRRSASRRAITPTRSPGARLASGATPWPRHEGGRVRRWGRGLSGSHGLKRVGIHPNPYNLVSARWLRYPCAAVWVAPRMRATAGLPALFAATTGSSTLVSETPCRHGAPASSALPRPGPALPRKRNRRPRISCRWEWISKAARACSCRPAGRAVARASAAHVQARLAVEGGSLGGANAR
jgi:hypothetical protein